MNGYKAFKKRYICKGFQYEIGKEYQYDEPIQICKKGFHFCKNLIDVFAYYPFDKDKTVIAEIEATGDIIQEGTKYCTNKIRIIRAVEWREIDDVILDGDFNSGSRNSGRYNSGYYNSGDFNSGSYNSGRCNNGDYNSGRYNSGRCNSGSFNSGRFNSGSFNSGSFNSGFFNTNSPTVRLFNKDSGMTFEDFFRLNIHFGALEESKDIIQKLPNYDAEIFYQATGIDWRKEEG